MQAHVRDLTNLIRECGLEPLRHYPKPGRVCIETRAPNGATQVFSASTSSTADVRADLNTRAELRRFARQNTTPEKDAPPKQRTTMKLTTVKAESTPAPTEAARELTPTEFYKLCEWVKAAHWYDIPALDAGGIKASTELRLMIPEGVLREAMAATGTPEPEHWNPKVEPHVIVARELASVMKALGVEPSPMFARMMTLMGSTS